MTKKQYRTKRQGGHSKEVNGGDCLAVIVQKGEPVLARIAYPSDRAQISRHRTFGHMKSELEQFAVDLWCTPAGVLASDAADQRSGLF
jgi:hypothetical protein